MAKSIAFKFFATIVCSICLSTSTFANSWWTEPYKRANQDINTLVITSNIDMPRIMADLIQYTTRQPYILFPVKSDGRIFLCAAEKDALEIKASDITRIISFLNPQQIIVLGNKEMFVPKFLKMIPEDQTVMTVYNKNWEMVAKTLSKFFNKPNLYYDFKELAEEYRGRLYAPTAPKKVELEVIQKDVNVIMTPGQEENDEMPGLQPAEEPIDTPIVDIAPKSLAPAKTPVKASVKKPAPAKTKTSAPAASTSKKVEASSPAPAAPASTDEPGIIMPKNAPQLIESK